MQNQAYFLLLSAALVGFVAASPLDGAGDPILIRLRRNRPCTFGCSTTVVGDGLNVQDNPNGDHHRVITNEGSWGSSSGYQPAGSQGGSQGGSRGGSQRPGAGGDRLTAGGGYEEQLPPTGNNGQIGGQGKPNDVKISQPCFGCAIDVQGQGNIVRS